MLSFTRAYILTTLVKLVKGVKMAKLVKLVKIGEKSGSLDMYGPKMASDIFGGITLQ